MRWLMFWVLAIGAVCLQTTVVPLAAVSIPVFQIHHVCPQLLMVLLVHYSLHGRAPDVLIGGWLLGLLIDLNTVVLPDRMAQFGWASMVYGLLTLLMYLIRDFVFTRNRVTYFSLTFAACLIAEVWMRWVLGFFGGSTVVWWPLLLSSLATAVYTAGVAVIAYRFLIGRSRLLGLAFAPSTLRKGRTRFV